MQDREAGALQPVHNVKPCKRVQGIHQIEHFFLVAAGLEIDKEDIRRYYDFIDQKMKDLLLIAAQTAKANDHITIESRDVPTTKGLQESIHEFASLDVDVGLKRILQDSVPEPPTDRPYSDEAEARLPAV